ncbi:DNA phosphorothioation-associated putative methyltransferase [Azospirillum sp. RWY-5-1]|uniref:DNA phosphorothioation-associated putative methyltransferase n=1 Tax=Azospirillum oleiclasticum TaxID=2735135 RepID=A0ABX2TDR9_9PROT|nr:DNA phosphorothioation-associated putative methyltransferase [Azospirillum oleiclasticum]NYZ14802.1 DNA phosphorothioation-associated putative methyltransferase [Azospirillum oleiclasticum]NYZ22212.1 DNA phosphorothioation-associated putative methyltransferase [Azospirillum oleiclasticum]
MAEGGGLPGKRVGRSVYLYRTTLDALPGIAREAVSAAARAAGWDAWNVVRVDDGGRVSLLEYESFDDVPFPALLESRLVDAEGRVARRDYRASANPPILHRKELLLPAGHPRAAEFAALTARLEARGLFDDANRIGTREAWKARLRDAGIVLDGHAVAALDDPKRAPSVARHKTAIARQKLSVPVQALVRAGIVIEGCSVFDYGCGRGDDVAALALAGVEASGWDPHWRPDAEIAEADVVNLGFVLNVIERPEERVETARKAYALARVCLCVGVMLVGKGSVVGLRRLGDGYVSNRGTFQKYFTQAEAKGLLERALGLEAIAAAPGVFFVFKDKIEEQRFLARRHRQVRDVSALIRAVPPPRPRPSKAERVPRQPRLTLAERHRDVLAALWGAALDLGRMPTPEELPAGVSEAVMGGIGTIRRAFGMAEGLFGGEGDLSRARDARTADLTVYFALNLFNRRQAYGELPPELQRDVKAFFGSLKDAETAGRELLFSLGRPETVGAACREAAALGLGHLDGDHSLLLDARLADRLPAPLRAYIGCAEKLYGSVDGADVLKIHIGSGKLTLLRYDGYADRPLPRLVERVKIRLRDVDWDEFAYGDGEQERVLVMKSLLMAPDLPGYAKQVEFDKRIKKVMPNVAGPIDIPGAEIELRLELH